MSYFKNKVIIITGASSGIGKVAAFRLSELGAKMVLAARNEKKLIEIADRISKNGFEAAFI